MKIANPPHESREETIQQVRENFPDELLQRAQWICWEMRPAKEAGKKPRKVPVDPQTRRPASATDPSTWASFDIAAECFTAHPHLVGLGFVFSKDDPFVGVDLDNCCDPFTGDIEPWAVEIIDELSSYTEVSPSGTGFHVILRGSLPPGGRKKGNIEMYESGRYFTVTGARL